MTARSKTHTSKRADQPLLTAWQTAGLGPLYWLAPHVVQQMSDLGAEWLSFVAARVQEDVALQHALLHAKSPAQAQAIQTAFLNKAMDQYRAETGRIVALGAKLFETDADADDTPETDNLNV